MRLLRALYPQGTVIFAHAAALSRLFPSAGALETRLKAINPLTKNSRTSEQDAASERGLIPNKSRPERAETSGGSGLFLIESAEERLP